MGKKVIIAQDDLDLKCLSTVAGGWTIKTAGDGGEALRLIQRFRSAVVAAVIDLDSPNDGGLDFLRQLRLAHPELPLVALTNSDSAEETEQALEAGATECAHKPIIHEEFVRILQRVTKREAACRCDVYETEAAQSEFLHLNPQMRAIQQSLRMLAPWNVPVIFLGETGVGKEVAARELHRLSSRSNKPFIKINCAAVPSELLESELFGYEKGAFTGALRSKPGKFEMADGGVVLLDEIGDMHSNLQAKLLQVLQDGEFDRLGGRHSVRVDVRVLAATHRDLRRAVETGAFREDLYYRLNVATVAIPPLRERKDEILPLAENFIIKHGKASGMDLPEIPALLRQVLTDYPWPGNVRELENVVRKFLVFRQPEALATELWKRISYRRPMVAGAGAKSPARNAVVTPIRPDPNGVDESVAYTSGYTKGVPAEATAFPMANGGGGTTNHSAEWPGQPHRSNGYSASRDAGSTHLAASREQGNEALINGTNGSANSLFDSVTTLDHHRLNNGNGAVKDHNSELDLPSDDFKNGEQLSTLAQVEELSREFERRTILAALQRSTWNRKKAAKMLEIDYKGLLYKMKKLEIA